MTDTSLTDTELVSALVDGQVRGDEFAQAMALLERSSEARQRWHAYHVLGDVLRTGQVAVTINPASRRPFSMVSHAVETSFAPERLSFCLYA